MRDKKVQPGQAAAGAIEKGDEGPAYAAMFSGTTVDSSKDAARTDDRAQYSAMTAADAMNRQPVVVLNTANMAEVIEVMAKCDTSGVPVVDGEGNLVGFVSDGDVASYLGKSELSVFDPSMNLYRFADGSTVASRVNDLLALNVMAIATKHVIYVQADTPFDEACHILAERRIKRCRLWKETKWWAPRAGATSCTSWLASSNCCPPPRFQATNWRLWPCGGYDYVRSKARAKEQA